MMTISSVPDLLPALDNGSIDASSMAEPSLSAGLARGEIDTATYSALRDTLRETHTGKA